MIFDWLVHKLPLKYPYVLFALIPIALIIIILTNATFVRFSKLEDKKEFIRKNRLFRAFIIFIRLLIFTCLILALATPFMIEDKTIKGDPSILILADDSQSFELFEQGIGQKLKEQLEAYIPTEYVSIASGNYSAIGDGILNNMRGDDNILIISDGNNNYGRELADILMFSNNLKSTINAVDLTPIHDDTSVTITCPKTAIVGSEVSCNIYTIQAGKSTSYNLKVDVDGNNVIDTAMKGSDQTSFSRTMTEGYHKITAKINTKDYFMQNNIYYKTVQVIPKPKLLYLSKKSSPITSKLSELYNVDVKSGMPSSIDNYAVVVLNDLPENELSNSDINRLSDYLTDGGGLVVIGGENSYDLGGYPDSMLETLLPVKSGEGEKMPEKNINIVMVIDISGSTGGTVGALGGGDVKVDVEKALAVKILKDDIKDDDNVGVVAFNAEGFIISRLSPLIDKKFELTNVIAALQDGGGTDISKGLMLAEQLLFNAEGSKNVILISDGITTNPDVAKQVTSRMNKLGITTYSVGVGEDTDEEMMDGISRLGDGIFFQPNQAQHLKIIFGNPDDDDEEKNNLVVLNSHHFITQDLELTGKVTGFNQVVPKASASTLVTTGFGAPLLVGWRFGLGRSVSIATDDGSKYAAAFLKKENSKVITRAINWAIGDPTKTRGFGVFSEDTSLGRRSEIIVKSEDVPHAEDIEFRKIDENKYSGIFKPEETGFFEIAGASIAVNYNDEIEQVGMNPELPGLVRLTEGEMFKPDDIEGIIEKAKNVATHVERKETSYRWPFIIAAIILFLFEIIARRVRETAIKNEE